MTPEQMWDSFVTLINDRPDLPNIALREQTDAFLANARKLGEALDRLSAAELLQRADITSEIFKSNVARFKVLQRQLAEARERGDKAQIPVLGKQLGALRKTEIETANEHIYVPAVLKLSGESRQSAGKTSYEDIEVPGYMPRDRTAEKAEQTKLFLKDAARHGFPPNQQDTYVKHRQSMMRLWPRAAEIDSPAPPGHALREFGQSDRESVENANHEASVPQALALMNGQLMTSVLNPWSQLMQAVKRAPYPDEQVRAVYLTLFSRAPTANERAAWEKAQVEGGLNKVEDLVYALLNTQQFIFVQ
jgi:hypothetical protein